MKFSLVFSFFRSLSLAHLERSLYSLSRQTVKPDEMIFHDNDTDFSELEIMSQIARYWPVANWNFSSAKHGDPAKRTASWSQNQAIRKASYDCFIFVKADCIYSWDFCERLLAAYGGNPMNFSTSWLYQMPYLSKASHEAVDHAADLEPLNWREDPRRLLQNSIGANEHKLTQFDAPAFCTSKHAMDLAGWYDEGLTHWGYWQQDLQRNMGAKKVQFHVIPEFLQFHMMHAIEGGERDPKAGFAQWMQRRPK